jgi:hypothetical protein
MSTMLLSLDIPCPMRAIILHMFCGAIIITVQLNNLKRDTITEIIICMLLFSVKLKLTVLQRPECLIYDSGCGRVMLSTDIIAAYCKILTLDLGERAVLCLAFACVRITMFTSWRLRTTHVSGDTRNTTAQAEVTCNTIVSFPACVP